MPPPDAPNAPSLNDSQREIAAVCDEIRDLLLSKNRAYGDSALSPLRVFSRADPVEQIRTRIDDKLSRLARGKALLDESLRDTRRDLLGYLVLLEVAERRQLRESEAKRATFEMASAMDGTPLSKEEPVYGDRDLVFGKNGTKHAATDEEQRKIDIARAKLKTLQEEESRRVSKPANDSVRGFCDEDENVTSSPAKPSGPEFWVDPEHGSGHGSGTKDSPFQNRTEALQRLRVLRPRPEADPTLYWRQGTGWVPELLSWGEGELP